MTKRPSAKSEGQGKTQAKANKRGRPAKSEAEKAAAKAAKEAEKAAAKKAEGEKRVEAAKAVAGHNSGDPNLKKRFLETLPKVIMLKKRIASATGELRGLYKDAKRDDGFTKDQFETAILCQDPENEAKLKERMEKALQAAQFVGAMLGKSLDLFSEPDRTPAADRAYEEGQRASMENRAALPPYAPETEQYRRYMEGFHEHQASIAAKNLKPINPPSPPPASEVTSGVAMTRSQFNAPTPTAPIAGSGAENDSEAEDDGEEFADRQAAE